MSDTQMLQDLRLGGLFGALSLALGHTCAKPKLGTVSLIYSDARCCVFVLNVVFSLCHEGRPCETTMPETHGPRRSWETTKTRAA